MPSYNPNFFSPSLLSTKFYNVSRIPDAAYMSSTYYACCSSNPNNIRRRIKIMKLCVRQFYLLYCYMFLLNFPKKLCVLCCENCSSHYWISQINNICTVYVCKVIKYSATHCTVENAFCLLRTPLVPKPTTRSHHEAVWQYFQLFQLLYYIIHCIVMKIIQIAWKLNQPCGKECN